MLNTVLWRNATLLERHRGALLVRVRLQRECTNTLRHDVRQPQHESARMRKLRQCVPGFRSWTGDLLGAYVRNRLRRWLSSLREHVR